jgi:hypothetical protein
MIIIAVAMGLPIEPLKHHPIIVESALRQTPAGGDDRHNGEERTTKMSSVHDSLAWR